MKTHSWFGRRLGSVTIFVALTVILGLGGIAQAVFTGPISAPPTNDRPGYIWNAPIGVTQPTASINIDGSATVGGDINIGSAANIILGNQNQKLCYYDASATPQSNCPGIGAALSGGDGSWAWNGFALTPTSTTAGIFVNASSTFNAGLRVNGGTVLAGSIGTGNQARGVNQYRGIDINHNFNASGGQYPAGIHAVIEETEKAAGGYNLHGFALYPRYAQSGGTLNVMMGQFITPFIDNSATVNSVYNLKIDNIRADVGTPVVANQYGIYIPDFTRATRNYPIYQEGNNDTVYLAGNVGIATTTPGGTFGEKLAVVGNMYVGGSGLFKAPIQANVRVDGPAGNTYNGFAVHTNGAEKWYIGRDGAGGTDGLLFRSNSATNRMLLDQAGHLGIGTMNPVATLDVDGPVVFTGGSGDVNGDGQVNTVDALMIARYIDGTLVLTRQQLANADVNADGQVSLDDKTAVLSIFTHSKTKAEIIQAMNGVTGVGSLNGIGGSTQNAFLVNGAISVGSGFSSTTPAALLDVYGPVAFSGGSGDVNGDGQVNTTDALMVDRYVGNSYVMTRAQLAIADVNGDGRVTLDDKTAILGLFSHSKTKSEIVQGLNGVYGVGSVAGIGGSGTNSFLVTGQIGVNAVSPSETLEVADSSAGTARIRITDTAQNPELQLQYGPNSADHWALYADHASSELRLWGNGTNQMVITPSGVTKFSGNVTIGSGADATTNVAALITQTNNQIGILSNNVVSGSSGGGAAAILGSFASTVSGATATFQANGGQGAVVGVGFNVVGGLGYKASGVSGQKTAGVYGGLQIGASGGSNWAGYFDGPVKAAGDATVNRLCFSDNPNNCQSSLGLFGPNSGIRLNTTASRPNCDDTTRGTLWLLQGVTDKLQVCARASSGYVWLTIADGASQ